MHELNHNPKDAETQHLHGGCSLITLTTSEVHLYSAGGYRNRELQSLC